MDRHSKHTLWFSLVVVLLIAACGQDPAPASLPKVQTKKISSVAAAAPPTSAGVVITSAAPQAAPAPAEEAGLAPSRSAGETEPAADPGSVAPPLPQAPAETALANAAAPPPDTLTASAAEVLPDTAQNPSNLVAASLQMAGTYDSTGRFDPFEPLFKESPQAAVSTAKDLRKKRTPQTPLEQVALAQLKLSAVIRAPSGNRALVEDATGKGFVVEKGTFMGLNSGQVVRIEKDRLIVEEEIENVMGELTVQATELKLQKPAGEL